MFMVCWKWICFSIFHLRVKFELENCLCFCAGVFFWTSLFSFFLDCFWNNSANQFSVLVMGFILR